MKKPTVTFEFCNKAAKDHFIGYFLDGGGDQSFDIDCEYLIKWNSKQSKITVEPSPDEGEFDDE